MHPCLWVDEIVRFIAAELVASGWKATTVTLACCCKALKEPALDAVWVIQDQGFTPLLGTLPEGIWDSFEWGPFEGIPTELEWARLRECARRIRTLSDPGWSLSPRALWMFQFYASCEPLLPRLESLTLHGITEDLAPFIPLFLSPRTTSILFSGPGESAPEPVILPAVAALLVLCPNLQRFGLHHMPRDPVATDAVLKMLLNINQNILQVFDAGSPLTNEAKEFICKLPGLRELRIDIGESGSLPTLILPNLTKMDVCYDRDPGWLHAFRGAELGKLVSITLYCRSNPVNGISDVFESVALSTSIHTTLTRFQFRASHPHSWRPNYRSLLQFTQLKKLVVDFTCHRSQQADCSSTIGDDIITDFARAMPKLELLIFREGHASNGVTIKGLVALACYCPHLSLLSIHFQAASLELDPSEIPWATPGSRSSMPRGNCALTSLVVGDIPLAEGSVPAVTQTLLRIFPNLTAITNPFSWSWRKVAKLVRDSKPFADRSGSTLGNTVWL